jgi:hypothetical protein
MNIEEGKEDISESMSEAKREDSKDVSPEGIELISIQN